MTVPRGTPRKNQARGRTRRGTHSGPTNGKTRLCVWRRRHNPRKEVPETTTGHRRGILRGHGSRTPAKAEGPGKKKPRGRFPTTGKITTFGVKEVDSCKPLSRKKGTYRPSQETSWEQKSRALARRKERGVIHCNRAPCVISGAQDRKGWKNSHQTGKGTSSKEKFPSGRRQSRQVKKEQYCKRPRRLQEREIF